MAYIQPAIGQCNLLIIGCLLQSTRQQMMMSLETVISFWMWSVFNLFNLIYQGIIGFLSLKGKAWCMLVHLPVSHQNGSHQPCSHPDITAVMELVPSPNKLTGLARLNLMLKWGLACGPCVRGTPASQVVVEVSPSGHHLVEVLVGEPVLFQTILSAFWNTLCFIAC